MTLSTILKTVHSLPHQPSIEPFSLYNQLDLTSITSRILVCSEPVNSQSIPYSFYKNTINDLIRYLNDKHPSRWMIFNLQQEKSKYDDCQVFGNIKHFPFPDHQPPSFSTLLTIIGAIDDYLKLNAQNVVVVHCKAGKGRSGTAVVGYLMSKYHLVFERANKYYAEKRMRFTMLESANGVSIQSQRRYLKYLEIWNDNLNGKIRQPEQKQNQMIELNHNDRKALILGQCRVNIRKIRILRNKYLSKFSNAENFGIAVYEYVNNSKMNCLFECKMEMNKDVYYLEKIRTTKGADLCIQITNNSYYLALLGGVYSSFWFNAVFERCMSEARNKSESSYKRITNSKNSFVNSASEKIYTYSVKFDQVDGFKGLKIKPGIQIFDEIQVDYSFDDK